MSVLPRGGGHRETRRHPRPGGQRLLCCGTNTCLTEHFSVINTKVGVWGCKRWARRTTGWSVTGLRVPPSCSSGLFSHTIENTARLATGRVDACGWLLGPLYSQSPQSLHSRSLGDSTDRDVRDAKDGFGTPAGRAGPRAPVTLAKAEENRVFIYLQRTRRPLLRGPAGVPLRNSRHVCGGARGGGQACRAWAGPRLGLL